VACPCTAPTARTPSPQAQRLIEVEWDHDASATFVVSIEVEALDRSRLLMDVAQVLSEHHVNILMSTSQTSSDRVARLRFDFELADPNHLESLLTAVRGVDSVFDAYRVLPGAAARNEAADPA
jgi:GTP pyrophosphokinase